MRQDILRVLQPLRHFRVIAVKRLVEGHGRPLTLLVDIGDVPVLRVEQDLSVVLEVHLNDLVAEAEHDGVFCPHPLLHVNRSWRILQLVCLVKKIPLDELLFLLWIIVLLQVRLEVL